MQVETRAQCCSSWPVSADGCDGRRHALVPVGCAGQPSAVRVGVSLRTLARRARGVGGGGCPASPGRRTCWVSPGGSGLGPVRPAGLRRGGDDSARFELVDHGADGHGPAGVVGDGLALVGQAACGDTPPRALVAVALPAAGVADGPLPAGCGGPVGGPAVPQHLQALRAVPGGAPRRDGDHGDARLGGQVPYPVHDLPAHGLGEPGVHSAAHAPGLHRAEVFDVDHGRRGGDGQVDGPACGPRRPHRRPARPHRRRSSARPAARRPCPRPDQQPSPPFPPEPRWTGIPPSPHPHPYAAGHVRRRCERSRPRQAAVSGSSVPPFPSAMLSSDQRRSPRKVTHSIHVPTYDTDTEHTA
ncbi:hypothetical protein SAMN04487980_102939 [Streptomyces sp. cf124]|nr:hypothetical protein SAMN04487980_102939 [Streptomyces sp. cf124]